MSEYLLIGVTILLGTMTAIMLDDLIEDIRRKKMEKIVKFDEYCNRCAHKDVKETEDPCNECLNNPGNEDSHRPVYFKEEEK